MNLKFRILAAALVFAPACGLVAQVAEQPKPESGRKSTALVIEPFMRVTNTSPDMVELQIALRRFTAPGGRGPSVWLSGVSHIGDTNYYAALQKHLDAQALVLFEGVHARSAKTNAAGETKPPPAKSAVETKPPAPEAGSTTKGGPPTKDAPEGERAKTTSMQQSLAESLGLVFQLDAIDFSRDHFRNSDLSLAELQRIMEGDPKDAPEGDTPRKNEQLDRLVKLMDGSSFLGIMFNGVIKLVGSSPKLQGFTRLALIETLGQLRGDISQMRGLPHDVQTLMKVLIVERNRAVMKDLKTELEKPAPAKSISVFYGAGHMEDFERRVRRELKLEPVETKWVPAFSVDLGKSGLTKFEAELIRGLVKKQMEQILP
jgi:hypothetical protein